MWDQLPLLGGIVVGAAAIFLAPSILKGWVNKNTQNNLPTPPAPKAKVEQTITSVFNAEDIDDLALAHVIQLYKAEKYDLAKKALDLAISQKDVEVVQ